MLRSCKRVLKFVMAGKKLSLMMIVLVVFVLVCQLSRVWSYNDDCGLFETINKNQIPPWIANFYQITPEGGQEFICSGTIVSEKIILTAASCFYDDTMKSIKTEKFIASVGHNSKALSSSDNNMQIFEIFPDNIIVKQEYKGNAAKYSSNIAIVKLNAEQEINFADGLKKACVYWDNEFVESKLETNPPELKVAAWEKNEDSKFTIFDPIYINSDECLYYVPKDFKAFITYDKMCAQVPSLPSLSSVGSGLYALNSDENRWFLIGIASEVTMADSKAYMTFIKIQPHLNWISNTAFLQVR